MVYWQVKNEYYWSHNYLKTVTLNKVTKDIKGNHKDYSVTKKSGIKRDMERKNLGQTEDKEQDDQIKAN